MEVTIKWAQIAFTPSGVMGGANVFGGPEVCFAPVAMVLEHLVLCHDQVKPVGVIVGTFCNECHMYDSDWELKHYLEWSCMLMA
jgi:hypothetical protein